MARSSKKNQMDSKIEASTKIYSVGIYARLSVDAEERKNESIETQIEIAREFLRKQEDMVLFDCYTDIGKTGTDFKRDGFNRMMGDVRLHKIDCIIVKDLSRFGRNYIETGNYMEKIFPFMGVRFIAVTDHFDSKNFSMEKELLSVNLKNLVNEMYARDISIKVKASKRAKWEQGCFLGGIPPYGYRGGWVDGKRSLFIEETTADIVRKMYEMFLSGETITGIVARLYEQRIVRPSLYHKTGQVYCPEGEKCIPWARKTVKSILTNPVYTGDMVQRITCKKDDYTTNRTYIDSEKWRVKEHTHEAVVSGKLFYEVAARFEKNARSCNQNGSIQGIPIDADIFLGVLFCGECGARMKRVTAVRQLSAKERGRTYCYNCSNVNRRDEEKCANKSIPLQTLTGLVKQVLGQEIALSIKSWKTLMDSSHSKAEERKESWRQKLLKEEKRIEYMKKLESEQYIKYRMGDINADSYKHRKEEYYNKILSYNKNCEELRGKLDAIDYEVAQKNCFFSSMVKGGDRIELTSEVVQTLISRIEVYSDHRVRVVLGFQRSEIPLETKGR